MKLTKEEQKMLEGKYGNAAKKSMEILCALGEIYGAEGLVDVASVQIAGVSYHNLGDAGLEFLRELARDGKTRVVATLNPAGMDLENWKALGISEDFAQKQLEVINAFKAMGVIPSCTCTPYLVGNLPAKGEHLAWSESSAVCFANSVLGARTNREGGPSALAAALTGKTAAYGMHLDANRQAKITVKVKAKLKTNADFGALGWAIGKKIQNKIPLIIGVKTASIDQLKSLCASIATYGGTAMFHMKGITPEKTVRPTEEIEITAKEIEEAYAGMNEAAAGEEVDFVAVGCPHASIKEIREIARMLEGKKVRAELWIATARPTKELADQIGYSKTIEASGAKFACDTCMAVAPLKGRFRVLASDSAKACYYGKGSNNFNTKFGSLEKCIKAAISGKWISSEATQRGA